MRTIDWLDFKIEEKNFKKILIVIGILVFVYLFLTFISFAMPRSYHMKEGVALDEQNVVKNDIDFLYRGSLRLEIHGWAYKEGESIDTFHSSFVLKNRETEKMYLLKSGMKERPELQFVDGYDCLHCGIEAQILTFGLKNGSYDLYILYQNNDKNLLVNTGCEVEI